MIANYTVRHRSILWKIPREELEATLKKSRFLGDVLRCYGLRNIGANSVTLKNRLNHEKIDYSHITVRKGKHLPGVAWNKGLKILPRISTEEALQYVFIKDSKYGYHTARRLCIRYKLIEYKCRDCGIINDWNGKPITIELEHIDGDRQNNELKNLCFLCPNCHSQTPTFRAKNRKKIVT